MKNFHVYIIYFFDAKDKCLGEKYKKSKRGKTVDKMFPCEYNCRYSELIIRSRGASREESPSTAEQDAG